MSDSDLKTWTTLSSIWYCDTVVSYIMSFILNDSGCGISLKVFGTLDSLVIFICYFWTVHELYVNRICRVIFTFYLGGRLNVLPLQTKQ